MSIETARYFRKNLTLPEVILWKRLKILPQHFRRQVPKDGYFLDFACLKAKLIIEIDGESHFTSEGLQHDALRDAHFNALGFKILRFTNDEVLKNCDGVMETIMRELNNPPF